MTVLPEEGLAYTLAGTRRANPYDRRRAFGQSLLQQSMSEKPIQHPLQGFARLAQALAGGWASSQADEAEASAAKDRNTKLTAAMSEADPMKRIGLISALDPELGARLSGQLAIEQAKSAQQREGLQAVAGTYGAPQSSGPSGPIGAGPPLPSGQPTANGFNNNLGNIRTSNANWQGKGAPQNGFETFNTPQDGANAMFGNLGAYAKANPSITVAQAIQKWAPPNENDTNLYIRQVMESTGINPAMPLAEVLQDPAVAATLMDAMTRKEKGGLPQGVNADTFMAATTPRGAPQGQPQPLQVNMPGPGGIPQGAAETNGMPPVPSPQGVQGPTMSAQPQIPQRMTPRDMPPQMAAPYIDRLRRGGYGNNPAEAEQRMVADMQRALDVSFENQKLEYERNSRDFEYGRKRGDEAPQRAFDNSNKLRDEFNTAPVVKNYREVTPIMESMKEAMQRPSRAADLNMVYALAKIMDPGSVVREGEMIMVNNTQGIGDRLAGMINSLNGGAQLTPETRQRIIDEAQSRYRGLEQSYKALEDHYGGMSDRFGLRREDVIVPIRKPPAEGGNAPPAGGGQRQRISLDGKPL